MLRSTLGANIIVYAATAALVAVPNAGGAVNDEAQQILRNTGVRGGLIVHIGCGDGRLTAALRVSDRTVVQGLDRDANNVAAARAHIQSLGLYGKVSVERLSGGRLPYADNLVNLVVGEHLGAVTMDEVLRVLCPGGVAYVQHDRQWKKTRKPRPETLDEWTHALHSASNNAVTSDAVVGPPRHIQWVAEPKRARHHETQASVSVVVSAAGRIFSIQDEGATGSIVLPAKWFLVARDAYNGLLLWKRKMGPWVSHLQPFRSGPPALSRRLVAAGERVYVTLGYGEPLTALDAATGETVRSYDGTKDTGEILLEGGVLFVVIGNDDSAQAADAAKRRGADSPAHPKRILAIGADSGKRLWEKSDEDTIHLMPTTLAVAGGRVFFQNERELLALDAQTGNGLWRAARYVDLKRPPWSAPTVVVYDDVVFSADRAAPGKVEAEPERKHKSKWIDSPTGELIAFSTKTGKRLWSTPCRESFHAAVDVLVAGGLLWTGELCRSDDPGITAGRDPFTGEIKRTRPTDDNDFEVGMPHHRCYRNRATENYLILGRAGVEFIDISTGRAMANHWIRGACQYGIVPCNGLLYVPPHSCACYLQAKLNGFYALAAREDSRSAASTPGDRLERGPAFSAPARRSPEVRETDDWPTYRRDAARSGHTTGAVSVSLHEMWQTDLPGRLSTVTVAEGKLFVASIDEHTVHALDAATGRKLWHFTAGGRVDSPPTIYEGLALFGSTDGWVYCIRAADGQRVWRFRAAPDRRRVVAFGQLESTWPVHGSVLVRDGVVSFAAGRTSYLDGGIFLCRVDVKTGKLLSETRIDHREAETGDLPKDAVTLFDMRGARPDVLSADGDFVYMRHVAFDRQGVQQKKGSPHLFCPTGLLDDTGWHRSYWIFGSRFYTGYRDWFRAGREVPAGRMLVFDDASVYGFGRKPQYYYWSNPLEYHLFASSKQPEVIASPRKRKRLPDWGQHQIKYRWSKEIPLRVRAMVLAADTLFVAGPPDVVNEAKAAGRVTEPDTEAALAKQSAALRGRQGAVLLAVSTTDGKTLTRHKLDAPPVFDGMAAAANRLYLSATDGRILCFEGTQQ